MKSLFLYNDYELIYYIRDGSEMALAIIIKKYDLVIYGLIQKIPYLKLSGKIDDLMQEGRMVLIKCLYSFRSEYGSFYGYFSVAMRNKLHKLLKNKYYSSYILMEDVSMLPDESNGGINGSKYRFLFNEHIEKIIYEEFFVNGFSLISIADNYNITYSEIIKVKNRMLRKLKTYLDTSK